MASQSTHSGEAQGGLLFPVSDVDDAECRAREQADEERIGGTGRDGTTKRHDQRWSDFETRATLDNLEPRVQSSRVRCAREKCAYAWCSEVFCVHSRRVHACGYWPISKKVCETTLGIRTQVDFDNYRDLLARQQFPDAISERASVVVVLTFCPTTLCLSTHGSAIPVIDGPKMTNSTMLVLVTSLEMMVMVVGVLNFAAPQRTPPSENLAILRIFGDQDPVCRFDESLTSTEYKVLLDLMHIEDS